MACILKQSDDPAVDFEGPKNQAFVITITPADGSSLRQTAATYDGNTVAGSSATFTLADGLKTLRITYAAVKLGERGALSEQCGGGGTQSLRGIRSTNDEIREYFIKGV